MRFGSRQVITAAVTIMLATALEMGQRALAARGARLAAFDGRCIPGGCVAPPSNTPGILGRRALPAGRLARLGATPAFRHGLRAADAISTRRTGGGVTTRESIDSGRHSS